MTAAAFVAGGVAIAARPPDGIDLAQIEEHTARARQARENLQSRRSTDDSSGLQVVASYRPEPPLVYSFLVSLPGTDVTYAVSERSVVTIDTSSGTRIASRRRENNDEWPPQSQRYLTMRHDDARRLLISKDAVFYPSYVPSKTLIYDAADPLQLNLLGEGPNCGQPVVGLPDQRTAIAWGNCFKVFDSDSGALLQSISEQWGSIAVGGPSTAPVIAGVAESYGSSALRLRILRWVDNAQLEEQLDVRIAGNYLLQAVDDTGTILIALKYDRSISGTVLAGLSMTTGEELWSLPPIQDAISGTVNPGGSLRLWVARPGAIDLYEPQPESAPRRIASIPVQQFRPLGEHYIHRTEPLLVAFPDSPSLLTIDEAGELLTIDSNDGSVLGRLDGYRFDDVLAGVDASVQGARRAYILGRKYTTRFASTDGGFEQLDTVNVDEPRAPKLLSRFDEPSVLHFDATAPLLGRYAAVASFESNFIGVFDFSTQRLVSYLGFTKDLGNSGYTVHLRVAGDQLVVERYGHIERFRFDSEKLTRGEVIDEPPGESSTYDIALRDDGTLARLTPTTLYVYTLDGTRVTLALPLAGGRLQWSPDQKRLFVDPRTYFIYEWPTGPTMVDMADANAPRIMWSGPRGADFHAMIGGFVRNGEAVAVTGTADQGFSLQPQLFDAETGTALGDPGEGVSVWFYYDRALTLDDSGEHRLIYWHWTFTGWQTTLYDVTGNTPRLIADSEEYFESPSYARHADGRRFYELRDGYDRNSAVLIGDPNANYEQYGQAPIGELVPLGRGFMFGREPGYYFPDEVLTLVRDPAVNRAPVATISGAGVRECVSPEGTPVELDSSASADPDSAPGTQDDIASRIWTLDGAQAGANERLNSTVGLGDHTVTLVVSDLIGAAGDSSATVSVRDTLLPVLQLDLTPTVSGGTFDNRWQVDASSTDRCEGRLNSAVWLQLTRDVLDAPITVRIAAEAGVDVKRSARGLLVVEVLGPDATAAQALWSLIRQRGGLPVISGTSPQLLTPLRPPAAVGDLLARFRMSGDGLISAAAYGVGADHRFVASTADSSGNAATSTTTLREARQRACAELPSGLSCVGGL